MIAAVPQTTDQAELIARAQAGDREALEDLSRQCWPKFRIWALVELGDPVLAEDAAQESLIAMVRFLDKYDPERPLGPWLRTLVRNQCRTVGRKRSRIPNQEVPESSQSADVDLDWAIDVDAAARHAVEAFCDLKPRQRQIIELVDRQDLAPAEAAAELDIPQGTARSLLHSARKALRTHMIKHLPELAALVMEAP